MNLYAHILAQGSTGEALIPQHCFYQNWGCAGVFASLVVVVGSFLVLIVLQYCPVNF